jgi:hypothetical protein
MASQSTSSDPAAPWMPEQDGLRSPTMGDVLRELNELRLELRRLSRELRKEQARHAETSEAYAKTVNNMVAISRENALLSHELERLRRSTPRSKRGAEAPATVHLHGIDLTPNEARAIRKAIARLHHPDVGGDEQRLKIWNAMLDQLDDED